MTQWLAHYKKAINTKQTKIVTKIVNLTQENSNNLWKPIYYCSHFLEWKKKSMIYFYLLIQTTLLKKFWCQIAWVQPLVPPCNGGILDRMSNNWLSLTAFPFYFCPVFWFVTFSGLQKLLMENECKIFMQLRQFNIFKNGKNKQQLWNTCLKDTGNNCFVLH